METSERLRLAALLCALVTALSVTAMGEEPVFFADATLKKRVEIKLWVSNPTPTDMLGLTDLMLTHLAITDLTGLEHATNLQTLSLRVNQISDLSPLSGLTNLQILHLSDNEVRDLSPLSGLTSLRDLDFHHNRVSDLSPLAGLKNLQVLVLYNNQISDLSPLLGLTELRKVELSENPLNEQAYCSHLQTLRDNNPGLYDLVFSTNRRPPANVTASQGTLPDRVRVTWEVVCNGYLYDRYMYYQVSRALSVEDPPETISDWQLSLSFDDIKAEPGMKYFYRVRVASSGWGDVAGDYAEPAVGWAPGPPALTITSGPGGAVTIPGEGVYAGEVGQNLTIHAEPADANLYFFAGWTGTAVETGLVADANSASTTLLVDNARSTLKASFLSRMDTICVDDDAPNDPGPHTPRLSDPRENGTAAHPFDTIQEAIEVARQGAAVTVRAGTYHECLEFRGRNIKVTGLDPAGGTTPMPFPVIDANYVGTPVTFKRAENPNCVLAGFVITRGKGDFAGAVYCRDASPTLVNCLIVGNQAAGSDGSIVHCTGSEAVFVNCTIAENRAGAEGAGIYMANSNVVFVNSIVWANTPADTLLGGRRDGGSKPWMTYSNMGDAPFAVGNVKADPLFACRGRWADPTGSDATIKPDAVDAVWIAGDYHLKSRAGRWEPISQSWVLDEVTSPCIDAGDPNSPVGDEPEPNGGRVNMGAYGGTAEASKSYLGKP